ncbi:MAG: hypothetical protein KA383_19735 [Phycisphaerae bacterium]|nr:hypothetical protein [Phycisphaerae bacterium]HQL55250.1 hypothetical protein [Phycisphaerae bacterium]
MRIPIAMAAVLALTGIAVADVWYDSNGFEPATFVPGPLAGQDGWTASGAGGGIAPQVVTAPDPVVGTQAVRLYVGDTQGDTSVMDIGIADPVAAGWDVVTVSYDIYRDAQIQNLWWWWWDAGEPTYGLQWDLSQATHPFGWSTGAGQAPTAFGIYANLKMEWNFVTNTASSWYNGVLVDNNIPLSGITSLTGWTIQFGHDSGSGTGAETVYIDNFVVTVTPEPAALSLLALGGLALLRRR